MMSLHLQVGSRVWSGVGEIYFEGKNVNFYLTSGFCWAGIIYARIAIARTLNSYVFLNLSGPQFQRIFMMIT